VSIGVRFAVLAALVAGAVFLGGKGRRRWQGFQASVAMVKAHIAAEAAAQSNSEAVSTAEGGTSNVLVQIGGDLVPLGDNGGRAVAHGSGSVRSGGAIGVGVDRGVLATEGVSRDDVGSSEPVAVPDIGGRGRVVVGGAGPPVLGGDPARGSGSVHRLPVVLSARPSCDACRFDLHSCHDCGERVRHGESRCDDCSFDASSDPGTWAGSF